METSITLNIDSSFRQNYYTTNSSDFNINLNYPLNNVTSMKLKNIQLPNTWHDITDINKNNYLFINGSKIVIPDGNYNNIKMGYIFQIQCLIHGLVATLAVDVTSGFTTITSTANNAQNIEIKFTEGNDVFKQSLGWLLGFRQETLTGATEYTSTALFNSSRFRYLYLLVDDLNYDKELIIANLENSYFSGNIIAILRVNEGSYGTINIDNSELQKRKYPLPVKIRKLKIKILDPYGKPINLNGCEFSFSLEFTLL